MDCAGELEGRMVTGETAFMASCLFVLESRRQMNRLSERLDEADQTLWEMRDLVTEHEAEIGFLNTCVQSLEERNRHWGRSTRSSHGPGAITQTPGRL